MMQKIQTVTTTHRVIKLSRGKNTAKKNPCAGFEKAPERLCRELSGIPGQESVEVV